MSARRLSAAGLAALHRAVNDPATVERFRSRWCRCREWLLVVDGRGGADLQHRADGLVSEGSDRTPPPVCRLEDVKISPANGQGVDSDDGVTAVMHLGQRSVGHPDLSPLRRCPLAPHEVWVEITLGARADR